MDMIQQAFKPILGLPSWLVRRGHGSFITLEFGEPQLTISKPSLKRVMLPGAPERTMGRSATVRGQWHLWIHCCQWSCQLNDVELAHDESDDTTMARALHVLNGLSPTKVTLAATGATTFQFDFGVSLRTRPTLAETYTEPTEQWLLYQPDGDVLTVRGDGRYSHRRGADDGNGQEQWLPLPQTSP